MAVGIKSIEDPRPNDARAEAVSDYRRAWVKVALLATAIAGLLAIVYFSPLHQYLWDLRKLAERIRSFGALGPIVLMASVAFFVSIGVSRLLLCMLAGMALGFWSGLLWAQLGTLLGNYVMFAAIRAYGRGWATRFLERRGGLKQTAEQRGSLGVILARQLPLPGLVINVGCALLPISHLDFLIGTILGQLPQAIPCTLIGAGVLQPSFGRSLVLVATALAATGLAWLIVRWFLRSGRQERKAAQIPEGSEVTRRMPMK